MMIAGLSVVSFVVSLILLAQEYDRLRKTGREALRGVVASWVRSAAVDDVGQTMRDYAASWRSATEGPTKEARARTLAAALESLGRSSSRPADDVLGLVRVTELELEESGGSILGRWSPPEAGAIARDEEDVVPLSGGPGDRGVVVRVRYQILRGVDRAMTDMEGSYRRLLLAVAGSSGYSVLCLAYMMLQAVSLQERAGREAAQLATLDLADRTCHELGNVTFVLANERRNLNDLIDLVERLLAELPTAIGEGARAGGVPAEETERLVRRIVRELGSRGLDPEVELPMSAELARRVCRQIEICSEYIALTVRELDGYLQQGGRAASRDSVAIGLCIDDALSLMGPRLEAAGATVVRPSGEGESIRVPADRRLLVHAVVNLIKNGLEASVAAGLEPRIELEVRAARREVVLVVRDRGPGIMPKELEKLFDHGHSTKGPGRGRGLGIARASLQSMGGKLTVESTPGEGAAFLVTLQRA